MTTAIQQTGSVSLTKYTFSGGSTVSMPSLMPEPQSMSDVGGDPMSMIYALMSKQRNNDMASGTASVEHNRELSKANQLKEEADLKKQEDAEQNAKAWGLFGKIASVIAIAVSAVASVCSCGAASGLCAAACVLSTLAFAEGEAHVLTQMTGNPDVDKAFQIGCGIGAVLCSGGAGVLNLATATAQTASAIMSSSAQIASASCGIAQQSLGLVNDKGFQQAAMAFGIAGSVCALAGSGAGIGGAATEGADAVSTAIKATTDVVKGASEVGEGVATIMSSQYEADATDRAADAKQAQFAMAHLQQLASWLIDGLKDTDKSHERALRTLSGAIETKAQTLVIASARV
jgi:hypothetical protein